MAICGAWGSGKSSFMKLMETEMLLQTVEVTPPLDQQSRRLPENMRLQMRRVASPKLICAWFNAW